LSPGRWRDTKRPMMRPMIRPSVCAAVLSSILAACGSEPPPVAPAPPPPSAAPVASVPPPADTTPPPPPEPTAEEKKKADDAAKLQAARAKFEDDKKAELARWTPEMHASAKAIADKSYPSTKAALVAATKGTYRAPGAADRDVYRHPVETLEFFGLKPTMTVLDIGPGDGWYTEIVAPVLEKKGHYLATSSDPNGSPDSMGTLGGQRYAAFLAKAPELYGKVQPVIVDGKAPSLGLDGTVDLILAMRELHGMKENGTLDAWLAQIHTALKTGGIFGVEEHRAPADANPDESAKKGYLPEKWVIATVEAAGFKLAGKSEINANPKDTKDYADGVWTLPPSFTLKDKDHDKYAAIGESDRMTLKFVKVADKKKPADKKVADKGTGAAPAAAPATK
jgi:predicted methyltransferase